MVFIRRDKNNWNFRIYLLLFNTAGAIQFLLLKLLLLLLLLLLLKKLGAVGDSENADEPFEGTGGAVAGDDGEVSVVGDAVAAQNGFLGVV
jgi:hypothetical protein